MKKKNFEKSIRTPVFPAETVRVAFFSDADVVNAMRFVREKKTAPRAKPAVILTLVLFGPVFRNRRRSDVYVLEKRYTTVRCEYNVPTRLETISAVRGAAW